MPDEPHRRPRWVNVFGIIVIVVVVLFVVLHIAGGGLRHHLH
jgi:ABC-type transporter Mla subunit MlaD